VCREIQREEEAGVRQRSRRDDSLARDVDTGKTDRRQDPDDDQERKFPVAKAQRTNLK
jgi:hypothetical protein